MKNESVFAMSLNHGEICWGHMKVKPKNPGIGRNPTTLYLLFQTPRPPTPANPNSIMLRGGIKFISRVLVAIFMRGLWLHLRCRYWNPYIGQNGPSKRTIDTRCRYCGQRLTFTSHRSKVGTDRRGRNRVVNFLIRPDHMPRHAIVKECRQRNHGKIPAEADLHFKKLGDIVEIQRTSQEGSISRRQEDAGMKEIGYTFTPKKQEDS
jgi:hypothetical protein